ncbi:MAG: segregation and condensation protein A [Janthinobacterium lividum]
MDDQTAFPPDAVHLSLNGFEGPLDLLLELARRQKVDLARISITTLVDQYLLAVSAERFDIIRAADWLVMAAWLTWLKSRLLLPTEPEEAQGAEQAQQVLTQRLIELERVRTAADWLDGQPQLGWDVFERGNFEPTQASVPVASYFMLMEACLGVLRLSETRPEQVYQPRQIVEWTPHQAMMRIQSMLDSNPRGGDLLGFVPPMRDGLSNRETSLRVAISGTLVAGLEMAREARLHLGQDIPFGKILVEASQKHLDRRKLEYFQDIPS